MYDLCLFKELYNNRNYLNSWDQNMEFCEPCSPIRIYGIPLYYNVFSFKQTMQWKYNFFLLVIWWQPLNRKSWVLKPHQLNICHFKNMIEHILLSNFICWCKYWTLNFVLFLILLRYTFMHIAVWRCPIWPIIRTQDIMHHATKYIQCPDVRLLPVCTCHV